MDESKDLVLYGDPFEIIKDFLTIKDLYYLRLVNKTFYEQVDLGHWMIKRIRKQLKQYNHLKTLVTFYTTICSALFNDEQPDNFGINTYLSVYNSFMKNLDEIPYYCCKTVLIYDNNICKLYIHNLEKFVNREELFTWTTNSPYNEAHRCLRLFDYDIKFINLDETKIKQLKDIVYNSNDDSNLYEDKGNDKFVNYKGKYHYIFYSMFIIKPIDTENPIYEIVRYHGFKPKKESPYDDTTIDNFQMHLLHKIDEVNVINEKFNYIEIKKENICKPLEYCELAKTEFNLEKKKCHHHFTIKEFTGTYFAEFRIVFAVE